MQTETVVWKISNLIWGIVAVTTAMLGYIFYDGLADMVDVWGRKEEYGYGYMIPALSLFLVWQRKDLLEQTDFTGSWFGALLALLGLVVFILGELSALFILIQYAFILVVAGMVISFTGIRGARYFWIPLAFLFFMIPLPQFLYNGLSGELQLISSQLGVAMIRLFDISVYLEGNVIDLGQYQLQVVEACSGLRYLFPLVSLSFITAYFYIGSFWKKLVIFTSSVPITIFMNSFRIGAIGILVEYWGTEMAEGFLHDFEGWAIFMACISILVLEMWLLGKVGKDRKSLAEAFVLDLPDPTPKDATINERRVPAPLWTASLLVVVAVLSSSLLEERPEIYPERNTFAMFPVKVESWDGTQGKIEQIYIDALDFTDYIMSDYRLDDNQSVNFYVAYYDSQRKGASIHSPKSCIPGGGWKISDSTIIMIPGATTAGTQLSVNRVEIKKGEYSQIVYYWFQGRSRIITNEYFAKFYLFWDALTRSRTDGALVRLTAFVNPGENIDQVDDRLVRFARDISPVLDPYIPR